MRFTLVAAVLVLVGCAGASPDPGSVVSGLTQDQVDQTEWLFCADTSDLVAARDLQGPADGYLPAHVTLIPEGIVVSVPLSGGVRPGGNDGDDGIDEGQLDEGGAAGDRANPGMPDSGSFWEMDDDGNFGFDRFDDAGLLHALGGEERYFVFHPGCA